MLWRLKQTSKVNQYADYVGTFACCDKSSVRATQNYDPLARTSDAYGRVATEPLRVELDAIGRVIWNNYLWIAAHAQASNQFSLLTMSGSFQNWAAQFAAAEHASGSHNRCIPIRQTVYRLDPA